jgi:hypothetical protein
MNKLSVKRLGLSIGILSAICMLFLGILGNMGIYMGAVGMMSQWHMFFSLSFFGIITGTIEAFVIGGLLGMGIAYFYNIVGGGK